MSNFAHFVLATVTALEEYALPLDFGNAVVSLGEIGEE